MTPNETFGITEQSRRSGAEGQRAGQSYSAAAPLHRMHEADWRRWPPALPCGYEVVSSSEQPARTPFRKFSI